MLNDTPVELGRIDDRQAQHFFEALSARLVAFAREATLGVCIYECNQPEWSFYCKHPLGGVIRIQLHYFVPNGSDVGACWISGHWWVDDESVQLRRSSPTRQARCLQSSEAAEVVRELWVELRALLGLNTADLTRTSRLYPQPQSGNEPPGPRLKVFLSLRTPTLPESD